MNRFITGGLSCLALTSCKAEADVASHRKTGIWRACIQIQGRALPFHLEVTHDRQGGDDVYIINGKETSVA